MSDELIPYRELTDAECDEILLDMARRGERSTRECIRALAAYIERHPDCLDSSEEGI